MVNKLEKRFFCISDYLFMNFLNTINGEKQNYEITDLYEENEGINDWLLLMKDKGVLNAKQLEKIRASTIDIEKVKYFRNQCRFHLVESQPKSKMIEWLVSQTVDTPLYFDETFKPVPIKGGADGLISLLSYDILKAYNNNVFHKIKKCEAPTCYALFVNHTGKRKWCSMKQCGNRTKANKHYAKKKQGNTVL
ncbi:CGNR zinc finger domain-containing protein [Salinicoccus albus]|uniref:CGNR zinc finger domain-containing protein n=1 Tax=Salinicoccus albus TaxID=418756 RepID=UPI0003761C69|nr:CGNR zinc finger domain-containing protein [Salinicoccus albus]